MLTTSEAPAEVCGSKPRSPGNAFGLTADTENDGTFGSDPWSGRTLHLDEADDVVKSLEDTIAPPSDPGKLEREFEDWIVAANSVS